MENTRRSFLKKYLPPVLVPQVGNGRKRRSYNNRR